MGYQRAEVLGAGLNAGALLVLALWIAVEAIGRIAHPHEILAGPMMAVAAIGLAINLVVLNRLGGHPHDMNTRAARLHVLGDVLGSIGALLAGAAIWQFGWTWIDPVASVFIALLLCVGGVRVLREVWSVLMHAAPPGLDVPGLEAQLSQVEGVQSVHALHVWTLVPGREVVTVHLVIEELQPAEVACAAVRNIIRLVLPYATVTVQPESPHLSCG
jgi:cobalt-zinc-cadmium efflux system protein